MVDNFAFADLPDEVIGFKYPFPRLAAALRKDPVRIVAMGSSSTAGRADVVPYPHWLEMYLRRDTGNARIDVLNCGKGGEEADKELPRFDPDIFAEAPSLVIWKVGTNAVFRNKEFDFEKVVAAIATGLDRLRSHSKDMDVMLIDPQCSGDALRRQSRAFRARGRADIGGSRARRGECVSPLGADAALARA